jgi:hypothetical protein
VKDFDLFKPLGKKTLTTEVIISLGFGKIIYLDIPQYLWEQLETQLEKK